MSIKEFIEDQLQKRAKQEPQFALKLQNKSKSIDQCVKYIYGEVLHKYISEHKGAQAAAVERDELVNMAVHYYDEDNIKIRPLTGVGAVRTAGSDRSASKSRAKAKDKETVKKTAKVSENASKREKTRKPKDTAKVSKKPTVEDMFFGTLFDESFFED